MNAVELLRQAREVIADPDVWVNHGNGFGEGKRCALQALAVVVHSEDDGYLAYRFLHRALPVPMVTVSEYNDDPDTTHEDILALYDKAIEAASNE